MVWTILVISATTLVAYSNGANDNFKGVATLFGSGTANYKRALNWATLMTFMGSVTAVFFAAQLVKTFSGKGLVPDALIANPAFLTAVILGAGLTVLFASKIGVPISTTHSLTGALIGSGIAAIGFQLNTGALWKNFFMPLVLSPFVAAAIAMLIYPLLRLMIQCTGIKKSTCICVEEKVIPIENIAFEHGHMLSTAELRTFDILIDEKENCCAKAIQVYSSKLAGIDAQKIVDTLHYLSAGALSFARGLNDTPKIVALSLVLGAFGLRFNIWLVALAMALGGIVSARRVAETMSHRITQMSYGQGFTSNLIASFLVIFASRLGLPVSTTHVSCGSLFGIGLVNGKANRKVIGGIISAWILTLPIAAILSGISFVILNGIKS